MRRRPALSAVLAAAAATVLVGLDAAPALATPTPTPTPAAHPHVVPPAAPQPTSGALSPDAPDPHPLRGGIGPLGEAVGGSRLLSRGLVLPPGAPRLPDGLTARAWALVDLDTGDILAARDPHGRYQPASILKTLTSVTLLPMLPGTTRVRVSAGAANTEGSHAGLVAGGTYTIDQLFTGLLLVSGNDTAAALAEAAGGVKRTVAMMNQEALRLGAYDTYVETPSGLDGWRQLTSAYDMAIFLRAAVAQPRFVAYDRRLTGRLPAQHTRAGGFGPVDLYNQSIPFLTTVPGALVAKTGYTDAAQHTFVGAIRRKGRSLGVVFLRAQRWPTDQWQQATSLIDWGFRLRAGTPPVGTLAPAVVTAPATTTAAAAVSSAKARPAAAQRVVGSESTGGSTALPLTIAAIVLVGAGVFAWRLSRLR